MLQMRGKWKKQWVFDASGAKVKLEIKTLDGRISVKKSDVWAESQIKHEPQRYSTIEKAD